MNWLTIPADLQCRKHPVNARVCTFLINLDRSPDRRLHMTYRLDRQGIAFERVSAVDGRNIVLPMPLFDEQAYLARHGRLPNPYEIGCFLSHVECARRLLASSHQHALVLEDDLEFGEGFADILSAALDAQRHWDILRLSTVSSGAKFRTHALSEAHWLAIALTREKGSGAYVINRKAAEWISQTLVPMKLPYDIAFDLEHTAALEACFVVPTVVDQRAEPGSYIQTGLKNLRLGRKRPMSVWWHRSLMESGRFLWRAGRLVAWKLRNLFRHA